MLRLFVFATFFVLFIPNTSGAYSCRTPSVDVAYKNAYSVFSGEIIDGMGSTKCGSKKMLVKVIDVYKGKLPEEVYISSGDGCVGGGVYLTKGSKYLLYTNKNLHMNGNRDLSVRACSQTKFLGHAKADELAFLKGKQEQVKAIDTVIQKMPDAEIALLKSKIEHFLLWEDFQNAEDVLRFYLTKNPNDLWAESKLIEVLYELKKAQEIWDIYSDLKTKSSGKRVWGINPRYISFAKISLGKPTGFRHRFVLDGDWFKDLNYSSQTIKIQSLKDTQFTNLDLTAGRITGNNIEGLRIHNSNLEGADLSELRAKNLSFHNTNLVDTNFSKIQIDKISFGGSDLTNANFTDSVLDKAYFGRQDLKNANFTNAKITNGRLQYSDFSQTILDGVSLEGAEYGCETKWPKGFDPEKAGAFKKHKCKGNTTLYEYSDEYQKTLKSTEFVGKDYSRHEFEDQHDFSGVNLTNANFSNAKLRSGKFHYANLTGANFLWANVGNRYYYATIKDVNFKYANLSNGDGFIGSDIENTSFEYAVMKGVTFKNVDVVKGSFQNASLVGAEITSASFKNSDFTGAYLNNARLNGADFSGANFIDANLEGISAKWRRGNRSWSPSKFIGANFINSSLDKADLRGVDFTSAKFKNTTVLLTQYDCDTKWPQGYRAGEHGAVLANSDCIPEDYSPPELASLDLSNADMRDLNLKSVNLKGANLRGTILSSSDLSSAILDDADLTLASFDCETKWPEGFDPIKAGAYLTVVLDEVCWEKYGPANLEGKNLSGMNLFRVPFSKANLRNANLYQASMGRADLFKADLRGANIGGVDMSSANIRQAKLKGARYDCNTLWPDHFNPEEHGAVLDTKPCERTAKRVMAGVRALIGDWRKQKTIENAEIENEKLHWFTTHGKTFKNMTFKNVFMRNATFGRVTFQNVKFINTDLRGANFEGSTFQDVQWDNVKYDCHTKGLPLPAKSCED